MTNIAQFNGQLSAFLGELEDEEAPDFLQAVALQALRGVVLRTPVDTGRHRGAWIVSQDHPAQGEPGRLDRSGGAAISDGAGQIQHARVGGTTWITNNAPAIERLEDGYSGQAPEGMAEITVAEIEAQFA